MNLFLSNVMAFVARGPFRRSTNAGWAPTQARDNLKIQAFDPGLLWVTVALLAWGMVMVYSASIAMPDNPRFGRYAHTYFLSRHAVFLVTAFVAAFALPAITPRCSGSTPPSCGS